MDLQVPIGDNSNTKSEEGTIAFHKKRARRVSFAENTSVHIFDRDEESGTPVDTKPPNSPSDDSASAERNEEPNRLFWNADDDDNDNENNTEDDDVDEPGSGPGSPFLRFVRSPSSGGSTIGSATSNDEDNFFGPVSTNFIRRDLLDSDTPDGNHDQTMDSTAFSMHFRSLARSDSEVELKTSTGVHLSFEEKAPSQDSLPTNTGASMQMTLAKKANHQPSVSPSKLSLSAESNDMSIVGEYQYKYDYGQLSPTLDAILAEGSKDPCVITPIVSILKSPRNPETTKENGGNMMDFSYDEDNKLDGGTSQMVDEVVSVSPKHNGPADNGSKISPSKQIALDVSYAPDVEISKSLPTSSSILATPIATTTELVKDAVQIKSSLDFSATSQGNQKPENKIYLDDAMGKEHKSPFVGSVNSLTDNPSHMPLLGANPYNTPLAVTPSHNQSSVFVRTKDRTYGGNNASIQKSISKLRMFEASPFSSAVEAKLQDSTSRSLAIPSKMTPLGTSLEKIDSSANDCVQLSSASQKKRERVSSTNGDDIRFETPKNGGPVTHMQKLVNVESPSRPPQRTQSIEKLQANLLSSAEVIYNDEENKIRLPANFGYSPQKKLKTVNASEVKRSPLSDAKLHTIHNEQVKFGPGHVAGSGENVTSSMSNERLEKSSPLVSIEEEMVDIGEVLVHEIRCDSEMKENSPMLLKDVEHGRGEVKRASLVMHEGTDKQSCQKNLHDQFCQSPLNNGLLDDSVDSLPEGDVPSPSPHRSSNGDIISDRQREAKDGMVEKTVRTQRSPNLRKGDVGPKSSSEDGISTTRHNFKHPIDINAMFSKEIGELLSQSVDKFSLHTIDRLADVMDQLQRSKWYQLLSEEGESQKGVEVSKHITHKRASEMKLLLCQFVHEKAKSQLLHVKREKLLKNVKSLESGILESEAIRLKIPPHQSPDFRFESFSRNLKDLQENPTRKELSPCVPLLQKSQIDSDEVTSMGQTIDHLDRRIINLTKSFHKSCKIKGEPSSADTIEFVNNYLRKRESCHILRRDLQLWTVDSLESSNVILNYLNLMTQRFTVNTGLVPSISISHELNDANISKIFKDMDAVTAFRFVFGTGITEKRTGATSLAQETQVTSSCFGNLLDVMDEIQMARIEIKNLVSTRFHTPLAGQLHLELCFYDLERRRKATATLDTSCLGRGIYPSEIIPCQIDITVNEIAAAFQDLKAGYSRIQRLCTCISKFINQVNTKQ